MAGAAEDEDEVCGQPNDDVDVTSNTEEEDEEKEDEEEDDDDNGTNQREPWNPKEWLGLRLIMPVLNNCCSAGFIPQEGRNEHSFLL